LIAALVLYSLLNKLFVIFTFNNEKAEYLDNMIRWKKDSVKESILRILSCGYAIAIGHIPMVQGIGESIMMRFVKTGMEGVRAFSQKSRLIGNILLLP
jgi:hypothetical protein